MLETSRIGLALLAGAFLTLACAPFYIFPLALVSSAFLLILWLDVSPKQAFYRGFFYGLGLFGSGVYWVYISIHTFAELPSWLALALTGLFISCLALFPAVQGWLLNRYFPRNNVAKILCAFPALWVLMEWTRSWLFSGFPWLFIGYSQTHSPLKGFAPILSVYGVSLATVLSAALIVNAFIYTRKKQNRMTYFNLTLLALIWVSGGLLNLVPWTKPEGSPLKVSLVQANIPQQIKWLPEQVEPTLQQYKDLSAAHWDSQVVVWPEAAIPAPLTDVMGFVDEMANTAKQHHAQLITGIPVKNPENNRYFNAVISIGDHSSSFYLKRRLVPFGEFIPLQRWLGRVFDLLHIPMSDFTAGPNFTEPLALQNNVKMLAFICYEIAFPEQALHALDKVGLLLTVTNDAWFGHSIAQAQHLQMAQMRAIETGRPVLFASNNGITAIISHRGEILSAAPPFQTYVLTSTIQPYKGRTPWQHYALDPLLLILLSLLIVAIKHRHA